MSPLSPHPIAIPARPNPPPSLTRTPLCPLQDTGKLCVGTYTSPHQHCAVYSGGTSSPFPLLSPSPLPPPTPRARQLTSSASAMVMSTAQPAMPARPMRCRVRRPARSTTNSCGHRVRQCLPSWCPSEHTPSSRRVPPSAGKATGPCRDGVADGSPLPWGGVRGLHRIPGGESCLRESDS